MSARQAQVTWSPEYRSCLRHSQEPIFCAFLLHVQLLTLSPSLLDVLWPPTSHPGTVLMRIASSLLSPWKHSTSLLDTCRVLMVDSPPWLSWSGLQQVAPDWDTLRKR